MPSSGSTRKVKAFSVVELLVVCGILLILVGILYPTLGEARKSALQTKATSDYRNVNLAVLMYAADNAETMPSAHANDRWQQQSRIASLLPPEWYIDDPLFVEGQLGSWPHSVTPYGLDVRMLASPASKTWRHPSLEEYYPRVAPNVQLGEANLAFNGLLHAWPTSAIAAPASLPVHTQIVGDINTLGLAMHNPFLLCEGDSNAPCRFVPEFEGCSTLRNGEKSIVYPFYDASQWIFRNGQLVAYADGSVRWVPQASAPMGETDPRVTPWAGISPAGHIRFFWRESHDCHPVLFRPTFDFQDFSDPVIAASSF